jgi:hypothetical protein
MNINENIIEFYNKGNSLKACERNFNISAYRIKKILIANNTILRSQKEQAIIENIKRTKHVDHFYFSNLNKQNVYLIGFLAGDGYVHPKRNLIKIGLSAIDQDFINTIKEKLQIEREVLKYQTTKGFDVVSLSFSSSQIKKDLAKYSVVNNKIIKGITMQEIPDDLKWHYIRGFFDADGCYDYHNNHRIRITSLNPNILTEIVKFTNVGKLMKEKTRNIYTYTVYGNECIFFIENIYKNATWWLPRKRKKITQRINFHETEALHTEDEKIC